MKKIFKWACTLLVAALLMGSLSIAGFAAEGNYVVVNTRPGDSLSKLAKQYGSSVASIAKLNQIKNPNAIAAGQELLIQTTDKSGGDYVLVKVKPGDNLAKLANQYGTSAASIAKLNQIKNPNLIETGQELLIYTTQKVQAPVAVPAKIHTVANGDTLIKIARRYNTTVQKLMNASARSRSEPM